MASSVVAAIAAALLAASASAPAKPVLPAEQLAILEALGFKKADVLRLPREDQEMLKSRVVEPFMQRDRSEVSEFLKTRAYIAQIKADPAKAPAAVEGFVAAYVREDEMSLFTRLDDAQTAVLRSIGVEPADARLTALTPAERLRLYPYLASKDSEAARKFLITRDAVRRMKDPAARFSADEWKDIDIRYTLSKEERAMVFDRMITQSAP